VIKEAIERIVELANKASDNNKIQELKFIPGNGRKIFMQHGDQLIDHDIPAPLRKSTVTALASLTAAALAYGKDEGGESSLWISQEQLVLVLDDEDRRESVTLKLTKTATFAKLESLDKTPVVDQATLIALLRNELRDAVGAKELLVAVRGVKFSRTDSGHSSLNHGGESLGNAIEATLTGAADIPEDLTVFCDVFREYGEQHGQRDTKAAIRLTLDILTQEQKFRLKPLGDELADAVTHTLEQIEQHLKSDLNENAAVLYGTP
jgi:hypothetical protein